jgi:hypothetical protein
METFRYPKRFKLMTAVSASATSRSSASSCSCSACTSGGASSCSGAPTTRSPCGGARTRPAAASRDHRPQRRQSRTHQARLPEGELRATHPHHPRAHGAPAAHRPAAARVRPQPRRSHRAAALAAGVHRRGHLAVAQRTASGRAGVRRRHPVVDWLGGPAAMAPAHPGGRAGHRLPRALTADRARGHHGHPAARVQGVRQGAAAARRHPGGGRRDRARHPAAGRLSRRLARALSRARRRDQPAAIEARHGYAGASRAAGGLGAISGPPPH